MIWMTWQQHRFQALLGGAALVLLALFLLPTGLHMAADYQQMGGASCPTTIFPPSARCATIVSTFAGNYINTALISFMVLLMFIPLIVGILVGAPLVAREVEQETYLLAWTQGITRQRWLVVKLAIILLAGVLLETCVTLLWTWWYAPLAPIQSPVLPVIFDVKGIVPIASMLLALSLAIAAGTLVRRTIPAIAITIVLYLAIVLTVMNLRDSVFPPTIVTWDSFTQVPGSYLPGSHMTGHGVMDHQMHVVSDLLVNGTCAAGQNYARCLHNHGWLNYIAYQNANQFWPLQGIEACLFLVLASALIAFTIWWIRYRIR